MVFVELLRVEIIGWFLVKSAKVPETFCGGEYSYCRLANCNGLVSCRSLTNPLYELCFFFMAIRVHHSLHDHAVQIKLFERILL